MHFQLTYIIKLHIYWAAVTLAGEKEYLNISWMEANYTNCQLVLHVSNVWQDSRKIGASKILVSGLMLSEM